MPSDSTSGPSGGGTDGSATSAGSAPVGRPIEPTDYLPRRLMGEYLVWFYETLLQNAPANLEVVRHYASAIDITAGDRWA